MGDAWSYERIEGRDGTVLCDSGRRSAPGEVDRVACLYHAANVGEDDTFVDVRALIAQVFQSGIVELDGGVGKNKMREQVPDEREAGASCNVKRRFGRSGAFAGVRELTAAVTAEVADRARRVAAADIA